MDSRPPTESLDDDLELRCAELKKIDTICSFLAAVRECSKFRKGITSAVQPAENYVRSYPSSGYLLEWKENNF